MEEQQYEKCLTSYLKQQRSRDNEMTSLNVALKNKNKTNNLLTPNPASFKDEGKIKTFSGK